MWKAVQQRILFSCIPLKALIAESLIKEITGSVSAYCCESLNLTNRVEACKDAKVQQDESSHSLSRSSTYIAVVDRRIENPCSLN